MAYTTAQVFNITVTEDLFKLSGFSRILARSEVVFTTVNGHKVCYELVYQHGEFAVFSVTISPKGKEARKRLNSSAKLSYASGRYLEHIEEAVRREKFLLSSLA